MKKTNILKHVLKALDFDIERLHNVALGDLNQYCVGKPTYQHISLAFFDPIDQVDIELKHAQHDFLNSYHTEIKIGFAKSKTSNKAGWITFNDNNLSASLLRELIDLMMDRSAIVKEFYGK